MGCVENAEQDQSGKCSQDDRRGSVAIQSDCRAAAGGKTMKELLIEARSSGKSGDVRTLAEHLMEKAFAFYEDPENEKAFQEWKREKDERERKQA